MTRVGIIEDDPVVREGLRYYFNSQLDFACTLSAGSVEEFMQVLPDAPTMDVILSDIRLPGISGLEGIKLIREWQPKADIIVITVYHDADLLFKALCAGANGYLIKNTPFTEIKSAINGIRQGRYPLSPSVARKLLEFFSAPEAGSEEDPMLTSQERQLVQYLLDGLSYQAIASHVPAETLQTHLQSIYAKLRVSSRAQELVKSFGNELNWPPQAIN